MPLQITLVVLFAALLHASWNALLRAGSDRLWSMTIMCMAIALVCVVVVFFVPLPEPASWVYVIASGILHVAYNVFLVRTYRVGDLGQTYPIARGTSPLLVAVGGAVFAGEQLDSVNLTGVLLVSGGIIALAFQGRSVGRSGLIYALGTGCFIGAYSVVDGIGVRLSGTPAGYTTWMCLLWGVLMPPVYAWARDWRSLMRGTRETAIAAGGGVVALLGYGIVIFAMASGPLGPVSALRETSVVFAALFGRFFLNERLTIYRIIACVVVALGACLIGHNGSAN
jgi:drug/metabolite transporter (DMT)-like permease